MFMDRDGDVFRGVTVRVLVTVTIPTEEGFLSFACVDPLKPTLVPWRFSVIRGQRV